MATLNVSLPDNITVDEMDIYVRIKYLTKVVSPILLLMTAGFGELREEEVDVLYKDD